MKAKLKDRVKWFLGQPMVTAVVGDAIPDIAGDWEFVCTTQGHEFSHGGRNHGGPAKLEVHRSGLVVEIQIQGQREWKTDADGKKVNVDFPSPWKTEKGFLTGPNTFEYEYSTIELGTRARGRSELTIVQVDGVVTRLEGEFYAIPPDTPVFGTVTYDRPRTT